MKGIDPSIRIVANGHSDEWRKAILGTASEYIDYLAVSNCPCYRPFDYETYQVTDVELAQPVKIAISAIEQYAPSYDADRSKVIVAAINVIK